MGPDGFLRYRYRGTDPRHRDNIGLRRAMEHQVPLVYLYGTTPGWYRPEWPVFVVGDDPPALTFTVAMDDPKALRSDLTIDVVDEARRSYLTRLARHRLHQLAFRHRVLRAYRESCTMCRLHHVELLDAAHILPDSHPRGEPLVTNGLALCKLHHAAFDRHIVGIRPDLVVEVRHDILEEIDGPMLRHGLQDLQGNKLVVLPARRDQHPDVQALTERYDLFRSAG
ncbi:MAG: HNH endonuclease [Actinomycetota bacterium]|nr:HNH endonuclease [Actinomycetota bacterium]